MDFKKEDIIMQTTHPVEDLRLLATNNYLIAKPAADHIDFYYSFWIDDHANKPAVATVYFDHTNHYLINAYGATDTNPNSIFTRLVELIQIITKDRQLLNQLQQAIE